MQAIFYQKYWNTVGKSIYNFVTDCFHNNKVPNKVNETLIVLIPKVENPANIKQFRPISLCDVSYKIITKLVVGRIKPLLDNIICPN